ncbi:hypothetical protein BU23DRAFT_268068 [Bimuria novae-zelandiae CBS 107.79]|uniref:Uncharacterized protein n=1 Tax=Bimuria novae-zelandiae CBS 107.79 TaxID=1447943 RepID=A0A6A5V4D4_9PLEO|nr:hypothetical protein BU23DRAFT_268068 [Bimuria novae-zelandiae CBS 107.79]
MTLSVLIRCPDRIVYLTFDVMLALCFLLFRTYLYVKERCTCRQPRPLLRPRVKLIIILKHDIRPILINLTIHLSLIV